MSETRYAPGDATAVVTRNGVALIGAELPAKLIDRIWAQLDGGRGLAAVIEALTGAFGTSLTAIPPFAVALAEQSSVRLAARGQMSISLDGSAGSETVSGAGVTTWSERVADGVTRIRMCSGTSATSPLDLPIRDGVVLAAEVTVDWSGAPDDPAADRPADAAAARAESASGVAESAPGVAESARGVAESAPGVADKAPGAAQRPPGSIGRTAMVPPSPAAARAASPETSSSSDLIDSSAVHSVTTGDTLLPNESTFAPGLTTPRDPAPGAEQPTPDEEGWEATVLRSGEPASERTDEPTGGPSGESSPEPSAGPTAEPGPTDAAPDVRPPSEAYTPLAGDHDGETVSVVEARAARTGTTDSTPPPLAPPRPQAIGRLRLSTGQLVLLDRTVVIGRRPRSTRVTGTDLPHLIVVDSPQQDISRSHVEVRTEGDSILVTDLHTTNGTTLLRAGADPVRLHPGERTVVIVGDRIDLGDGVLVTVEDAS